MPDTLLVPDPGAFLAVSHSNQQLIVVLDNEASKLLPACTPTHKKLTDSDRQDIGVTCVAL